MGSTELADALGILARQPHRRQSCACPSEYRYVKRLSNTLTGTDRLVALRLLHRRSWTVGVVPLPTAQDDHGRRLLRGHRVRSWRSTSASHASSFPTHAQAQSPQSQPAGQGILQRTGYQVSGTRLDRWVCHLPTLLIEPLELCANLLATERCLESWKMSPISFNS